MENLPTPQLYSKTVMALVAENHRDSERLSKAACAFCTQSVWSLIEGGHGYKSIECFCLKTHTMKWNETISLLPIICDGFTDKPLSDEE